MRTAAQEAGIPFLTSGGGSRLICETESNKLKELVRVEVKEIGGEFIQAVDARDLHSFLEVKDKFADWVKRYTAKFIENQDYISFSVIPENGGKRIEYLFALDMAKHVSMMSEAKKCMEVRQYFIDVEKEYRKQSKPKTQLEVLQDVVAGMVAQERKLLEVESKADSAHQRLDQIETGLDHFTVIGYARAFLKQSLPLKEAALFGKRAADFCTAMGILTGQVPDPRFGQVNTYPKSVLDEVFKH